MLESHSQKQGQNGIKMEDIKSVSSTSDSKNGQVQDRLLALKMLQRQHALIEVDFHRQFYALDMEYQQKRQLIYEHRKKIINGQGELLDAMPLEIESGEVNALQNLHLSNEIVENAENMNGIPKFWLQALKNCTYNDELIRDCDEEALDYLRDVRVCLQNEPDLSFTLEFEFGPNPYFENAILTKQYFLNCDSGDEFYGFSIVKAKGCEIEWKTGMNILEKATESFFKFFDPPKLMDRTDAQPDEIDSQNFFELQQDFEIGLFIKEKLVPNAVLYYLNEFDEVVEECETLEDIGDSIVSTTNI